nr:DUF1326 domain-containing protein [Poseidonocella sp. HB161398]
MHALFDGTRSDQVDGADMAGIIIGGTVQIPGNGLHGNWTRQLCGANTAQAGAAIDLLMGRTGGPLADLAPLARQYRGAKRASIAFNLF